MEQQELDKELELKNELPSDDDDLDDLYTVDGKKRKKHDLPESVKQKMVNSTAMVLFHLSHL